MFGKSMKIRTALFVLTMLMGFQLTSGYALAQAVCPTSTPIVLGPRTWDQWKAEAGWENYKAGGDIPPEWKLIQLEELVKARNATFLIFGGSWCRDSMTQLPVVFRLFSLAFIPVERQQLYGVDRNVQEPTQTADRLNITRVPTVVVMSNGIEIGRIAEFPRPDWEDDLLRVLSA